MAGPARGPRAADPRPPGSLFVAALGAVPGVLVALAIEALLAGVPIHEALLAALGGEVVGPGTRLVFAGAIAGFLVVGSLVRNRLALLLLGGLGKTLAVAAGMALGALVGTLTYAILLMQEFGLPLTAALAETVIAARAGYAAPFVMGGALAGIVGTLYLGGRSPLRVGARVTLGGLVGALAGLIIYCVAYVLVFVPSDPEAGLLQRFAAAMYSFTPSQFLLVALAATVGAALSRYAWRLYGTLTFLSLLFVVLGYLSYTLTTTLPGVPAATRWLSILLFVAELCSLGMVLLYSFYTIDVAARKHWRRSTVEATFSPYYLPKVAIHVPTFNEPFSLVRETLERLLRLDYPADRLVLMVGDDSTRPECSQPLQEYCKAHGIHYFHRVDRSGYKAGALNYLLERTPVDCNLLAVIDADYQVEPEYLRETAGFFVDPGLGWLQTPQDYRNRHQSFLTEQYYVADAYFYRTILPSRNEENSIIFCGTMGVLRMRAVLDVGGWNESCITEDAELSVRLLNAGWNSLYVNKTYGRGLIPPTFEAYKKQHYRWAFGGGKILRTHFARLLFGRFTFRQRLDYLVGSFNWFEGLFIFGIGAFILAMATMDLMGLEVVTHHHSEILLVGLVPLFLLLDGLTRVHLVLRRAVHLTFGGTLRILGMWFSVKFSDMRAALKAVIGISIPFVRTPKAPSKRPTPAEALSLSLRLTVFETAMATLLVVASLLMGAKALVASDQTDAEAIGRGFLAFWLLYYSVMFGAAPLYAYKSFVTLRVDPEAQGDRPTSATPPPATA